MKAVINISRFLGTATLVVALSMIDLSVKPNTDSTGNTFARYANGFSFIANAMAGTDIMTGGDGKLPHHFRFMYMLINGAGPNGYPTGMSGPDGGFLGMIRQITGPDALGGGLKTAGYTACTDVPSTGNYSMTDSEGTFKMYFETPLKTIPTGYTSAGSKFEKRVVVQFNGTTFMNIEFNCSNTVGWMRMAMGESGMTTAPLRNIEVYYDTESSSDSKLELYMYYEPGVSTGNEYFIAKFQTLTSSTYKFWIIRAQNKTSDIQGFRAAAYGDSSTDNVNAFLLFESSHVTDTSTTLSDSDNIGSGGDVQCIDYSTAGSPAAGTGCSSLTLTDPGTPIIDGSGNFSIYWTADTTNGLKNQMTALADPANP